ncbi:MAG: hypothetical protein Q7T56_19500 [Nocardioidaceae bacterium]|nr:hypothetical protein [Nocardioidaceae bacterium]
MDTNTDTMTWRPASAALPVRPLHCDVRRGSGVDVRPAGGTTIAYTVLGNGGALSSNELFAHAFQGLSTWGPPV